MPLTPILFLALGVAAASAAPETDDPPTAVQVHQSVERSLVFLEKSGMDWWDKGKCASCHHVPMSIWSLSEAKNRGFAVNDESLDRLRNGALSSYADHPKLKPVGQDGGENGLSMNTIYLTQAATSASKLDDKSVDALKKFTVHLLEWQDADGSWKSTATLPPVGDITEVRTMQILLALSAAHDRGLIDTNRWTASCDRALAWLLGNKFIDQNQSLNLRVLVTKRFGKAEDVQLLVQQLLEQQDADGGWSQTRERPRGDLKDYDEKKPPAASAESKELPSGGINDMDDKKTPTVTAEIKIRPSDALATGQTLYALTMAGVDSQHPAIQHAQAFLLRTQTKDGSWLVPFRSQKNSGRALTHYGTGWAAIGLMQTLPAPAGRLETAKLSVSAESKYQQGVAGVR